MSKLKKFKLKSAIQSSTGMVTDIQAQVSQDHHAGEGIQDKIPLERIRTNPDNPRKLPFTTAYIHDFRNRVRILHSKASVDEHYFSKALELVAKEPEEKREALEKIVLLAKTIDRSGLINPITVQRDPGDGDGRGSLHTIQAGDRRYLAHVFLARPTIKAEVRGKETDPVETMISSLTENINREDLTTAEEFSFIEKLVNTIEARDGVPLDGAGLHNVISKSLSTCWRHLRLMRGPQEICDALKDGRLKSYRDAELAQKTSLDDVLRVSSTVVSMAPNELLIAGKKNTQREMQARQKAGRKRVSISLGSTVDVTAVQLIMRKVLGTEKYTQVAGRIDWKNYDDVQSAWTEFFQSLAKS